MEKVKSILITGGSGMIGSRLTDMLLQKGYSVAHLGRSRHNGRVPTFLWDPYRKEIETAALENADAIIHLAGAGIADKRWNAKIKNEILLSRTIPTRFLREILASHPNRVSVFVSASGISYYGLKEKSTAFIESDPPGDDFMARVVVAWENEADALAAVGRRVVKVRTGVVLSRTGGALQKLALPVRLYVGALLGSGKQSVNWIHLDDICNIYCKAIEDDSMHSTYNAVAPHPVTNEMFTREVARILKRPLWLPRVPSFAVRLMAGGVTEVVLRGGPVSSEKIEAAGFNFKYKTIGDALRDLLLSKE